MRPFLFFECIVLVMFFLTSEDVFPAGTLAYPVQYNRGGWDLGGSWPSRNSWRHQTQLERWLNHALKRANRFLQRLGFPPLRLQDGSATANVRLDWGPYGFRVVPE
uniref:Putative conserved secreted protein n=1 Tax=Rhipicephalus microplus TaxID=6941 RepID=A0A6M2CNC5_RHIMP